METMYIAHVVFGEIRITTAAQDRQSAVFVAVGQAWSQLTLDELSRGRICSMPDICSFSDEEQLMSFLNEQNEGCDAGCEWLTYTVEELYF